MSTKRQSASRLKYLYDVVIPHLENMPTIEDINQAAKTLPARMLKKMFAVFDLNSYMNSNNSVENLPINDQYNCGRVGCLAGWYVMMGQQDGFLDKDEAWRLRSWSTMALSEHFGITDLQSTRVFSALGNGVEETTYTDGELTNKSVLKLRKARVRKLLTAAQRAITPRRASKGTAHAK